MRYKNLIITCTDEDTAIAVQKHLFKYKYNWVDYGNQHKQLKHIKNSSFFADGLNIVIMNDNRLGFITNLDKNNVFDYKIVSGKDFLTKFLRKQKLKKLNA